MRSNRDEGIWQTVRELAYSGAYSGWQEIDEKLEALGYSSASQLWSNSFRKVLDRICAAAKEPGYSPQSASWLKGMATSAETLAPIRREQIGVSRC